MADQDIQTRLNTLSHSQKPKNFGQRQVELVYWYCKLKPGESELDLRREVGRYMGGVSETTVWQQLNPICDKLKINDLRDIPDEVCNVFIPQIEKLPFTSRDIPMKGAVTDKEKEALFHPDFSKLEWPPDAIKGVIDKEEAKSKSSQTNGGSKTPHKQPQSNISWLTILLPLLFVCGFGVLGFNWIRNRNQLPPDLQATVDVAIAGTSNALPPVVETLIVEEIVEVTLPPNQTEIAGSVIGTVNALPTFTPALATVFVPTTIVETALATVIMPVTVEVTPVPPTPTSIPQTVVITEDFDDGEIDPAFTVSGSPVIVNGVLQDVTKASSLTIGDETWKNYRITFDFEPVPFYWVIMSLRDGGGKWIECLEVNNRGNCTFNGSGGAIEIPDTYAEFEGRVDLLVEDNQVSGSGNRFFSFVNNHSESGGIEIEFINTNLDNIVITRND